MSGRPGPFVCFSGIAPNTGDAAIGQSILHLLRSRVDLPVRVHTPHQRVFGALPEVDDVRPSLPEIPLPSWTSAAGLLRMRALLEDLRRTGGANALPANACAALRHAFFGCAALVFQGGPAWNDRMIDRRKAMQRWALLEAARHYGARVYHVGVSCGPFAWRYPRRLWMAPIARNALDRHDLLFVRDRFSRRALTRLGVTAPIVESTDAAVFLPSYSDPAFTHVEERIRSTTQRPRLVVCVRDYQPAYPDALRARDDALRMLARTLDEVQGKLADVFFLSTDHTRRREKKSDVEIAGAVQQMMAVPGSTVIDTDVRHPAALKHLYGQFDAMISMRLHPTILALDHGVPSLLLSYDPKCRDFFARLQLEAYAPPLAAFRYDEAIQQLTGMLGDSDFRNTITSRYAALKAEHAGDYEPMYRQVSARAREMEAAA